MIRGLLHGIRRCLLRVTQGFAARRRPGALRKRGGFMGRAGVDLFIEDGAYTTLSSAVVILVVLTLLFSSTARYGACRVPGILRWRLIVARWRVPT